MTKPPTGPTDDEIETALSFFDDLPSGDDHFEIEIKLSKLESVHPYVRTVVGGSGGWYSHFLKIRGFLESYKTALEQARLAGVQEGRALGAAEQREKDAQLCDKPPCLEDHSIQCPCAQELAEAIRHQPDDSPADDPSRSVSEDGTKEGE